VVRWMLADTCHESFIVTRMIILLMRYPAIELNNPIKTHMAAPKIRFQFNPNRAAAIASGAQGRQ
jgi:hypothetical protein